jgi:predicted alpha/beta-fold hydrolase
MVLTSDSFRPARYLRNSHDRTNLVIHPYGGHNGFIDGLFLKSWYEKELADLFDDIVRSS